jgi:site-specific recombinase XerD
MLLRRDDLLRFRQMLSSRKSHCYGGDCHTTEKRPKHRFWIHEQKRNKRHEIVNNRNIREVLKEYLSCYAGIEEIHESFAFFNTKKMDFKIPIKQVQAWKFIVSICDDVGLAGNYDTHSLRKTWGYHARMQGGDLALIMHKLNHRALPTPNATWASQMMYSKRLHND